MSFSLGRLIGKPLETEHTRTAYSPDNPDRRFHLPLQERMWGSVPVRLVAEQDSH